MITIKRLWAQEIEKIVPIKKGVKVETVIQMCNNQKCKKNANKQERTVCAVLKSNRNRSKKQ